MIISTSSISGITVTGARVQAYGVSQVLVCQGTRRKMPAMSCGPDRVFHLYRYESLGAEGYHSLFSWYQRFEAEHFPDPMGMRETITRWTGHLYPSILKVSFAAFDVPEAIAVSRIAVCKAGVALTRIQVRAWQPPRKGFLALYSAKRQQACL